MPVSLVSHPEALIGALGKRLLRVAPPKDKVPGIILPAALKQIPLQRTMPHRLKRPVEESGQAPLESPTTLVATDNAVVRVAFLDAGQEGRSAVEGVRHAFRQAPILLYCGQGLAETVAVGRPKAVTEGVGLVVLVPCVRGKVAACAPSPRHGEAKAATANAADWQPSPLWQVDEHHRCWNTRRFVTLVHETSSFLQAEEWAACLLVDAVVAASPAKEPTVFQKQSKAPSGGLVTLRKCLDSGSVSLPRQPLP